MKIIVEYVWGSTIDEVIRRIKLEAPTHLIWLGLTEFNFPEHWRERMDDLLSLIQKKDIKLEFVTGNSITGEYIFKQFNGMQENITIHPFPMYFIYETVRHLRNEKHILNIDDKIENRSYINLNRMPHRFRCQLIDELYHNDLFDNGYNSWLRPNEYNNNYPFKYWKEERLVLPHEDKLHKKIVDGNDLKTMFTPPPEYFQAGYNLVAESTDNILFYTEKTFKNYWFRKPFIICGAQNINHTLKYYGFELYDEIFDYSFDFKTNIDDRIEGIIKNVINLKEINTHYLWEKLEKKLNHNYNNMLEIFYSKKYLPPVLEYHLKNGVKEIKSKI